MGHRSFLQGPSALRAKMPRKEAFFWELSRDQIGECPDWPLFNLAHSFHRLGRVQSAAFSWSARFAAEQRPRSQWHTSGSIYFPCTWVGKSRRSGCTPQVRRGCAAPAFLTPQGKTGSGCQLRPHSVGPPPDQWAADEACLQKPCVGALGAGRP